MSTSPTLSSSTDTGDFTASEIRILEESGILLPPIPGSSLREVNTSALYPRLLHTSSPSISTSAHPNPNASVTISFKNYPSPETPDTRTTSLPLSTSSVAALEFIGFTPSTAAHIFTRWSARSRPDQNPNDILSYALSHIRGKNRYLESADGQLRLEEDTGDEWKMTEGTDAEARQAMEEMGLEKEIGRVILDPKHAAVRGTGSVLFWVEDPLGMRWRSLGMLLGRLRRGVEMIREEREREGG